MTRPRTIAPVLSLVVQTLGVDNKDRFEARRELRALTTLFRKSAHLAELIESAIRNGSQVCGSEVSFVLAFKNVQRDLAAAPSPGRATGRRTR